MAVPGADPLTDLREAYASVCAAIRDVMANPKPSYTLPGGASINREQYYAGLCGREKELRAIPGVAPSTNPSFQIDEYL